MQILRPYVWLRKQSSQYNAYFSISIPADYRITDLSGPTDNTSTGVRTYNYGVEAHTGAPAVTVDSNIGNHSQPANISKLELVVINVTDPAHPDKKGVTVSNYQDADDMG